MSTKQKSSSTHLVHLVPLGIDGLVDDFALEELRPHLDDSVRVRLAFNQPPKELVLPQKLLSLQEVDPQNPLMMKDQDGKKSIFHIYDEVKCKNKHR